MIKQPSIILCWIVRRQRAGRRWVEHVVDHLSAVEDARVDHLIQRRCVADRGEPKEADLAPLAQPLERRHHLTKHLRDADRLPAAGFSYPNVQAEDGYPVDAYS